MGKLRTILAATMLLVVTGVAQAATLVSSDFTKGDTSAWVLNGAQAKVVGFAGDSLHPKVLQLASDKGNQTGVAWTQMQFTVPSFTYIADVQIRHDPTLGCPADGFAMSFANVADTASVGGGGGALGLFGSPKVPAFSAFEVNEWRGQGLGTAAQRNDCVSGLNETFAFDVVSDSSKQNRAEGAAPADPAKGGAKIGQIVPPAGMQIVNGGFFRYQWNVAEDGTMTTYVTGLSPINQQFKQVKVLEAKIAPALKPIGFAGRFGLSAATGGAFITVEVAAARIDSPVEAPQ
jgi:Bacterial lectin